MGEAVGSWEDFAALLDENDPDGLVKELELWPCSEKKSSNWTEGTHLQFGITSILCEGAGAIYTKEENIASGAVLMKSIAEHHAGGK